MPTGIHIFKFFNRDGGGVEGVTYLSGSVLQECQVSQAGVGLSSRVLS